MKTLQLDIGDLLQRKSPSKLKWLVVSKQKMIKSDFRDDFVYKDGAYKIGYLELESFRLSHGGETVDDSIVIICKINA
jgi:hypothetical protein